MSPTSQLAAVLALVGMYSFLLGTMAMHVHLTGHWLPLTVPPYRWLKIDWPVCWLRVNTQLFPPDLPEPKPGFHWEPATGHLPGWAHRPDDPWYPQTAWVQVPDRHGPKRGPRGGLSLEDGTPLPVGPFDE